MRNFRFGSVEIIRNAICSRAFHPLAPRRVFHTSSHTLQLCPTIITTIANRRSLRGLPAASLSQPEGVPSSGPGRGLGARGQRAARAPRLQHTRHPQHCFMQREIAHVANQPVAVVVVVEIMVVLQHTRASTTSSTNSSTRNWSERK